MIQLFSSALYSVLLLLYEFCKYKTIFTNNYYLPQIQSENKKNVYTVFKEYFFL